MASQRRTGALRSHPGRVTSVKTFRLGPSRA
jgi:hypothetical protein